jgi:hypothetical protein
MDAPPVAKTPSTPAPTDDAIRASLARFDARHLRVRASHQHLLKGLPPVPKWSANTRVVADGVGRRVMHVADWDSDSDDDSPCI